MKKQSFYKRSEVLLSQKFVAFFLILVISLTGFSLNLMGFSTPVSSGVDITYEVNITNPPEAGIKIKATYANITTSTFRLEIGYKNWPTPTLEVFKDLQFSSPDGKSLSWKEIDYRTVEINANGDLIIANYSIDLTKTNSRATKVAGVGGVLSGFETFPVPGNQDVNSAKVKFTVPRPWKVVSVYPKEGEWVLIKPLTYEDISLETQVSPWYFGNIDFDYTKTYDDEFKIRVVGFKYFEYDHWNLYLNDTPLEEALKCADFYHKAYTKYKELYGEFPFPKILLIGPGFWQSGATGAAQGILAWYHFEAIPHALFHTYFSFYPGRIIFSGYFFNIFPKGGPTYCEGFMAADIANNPIWRGMVYERKFQYIRGKKFNNLKQNWSQDYVSGFIATFLMDKEIKKQTNSQKDIYDLLAAIWKKYNKSNPVRVSDEQVLQTLKEITGNDWHSFYEKNIVDTSNLDTDSLDELKDDFRLFLKVDTDYWYSGNSSMYFVTQELISAIGNFNSGVQMQLPPRNIGDFTLEARKYKDISQYRLTEEDIEEILHRVTGKDHSDFFEFYRNLGFDINPHEIDEYVRTFTYKATERDNAVRLIPNTFSLNKSTGVVGEIVDKNFADADEFGLDVWIYDSPIGLSSAENLLTGKNVSFNSKDNFQNGGQLDASGIHLAFGLPRAQVDNKTYTFFKINLPDDAGVMAFSFYAKDKNKLPDSDFIGTKKVFFQSNSTFYFKPGNFNVIDDTPPIFSITDPESSKVTIESNTICIKGLVEPEATILINDQPATISNTSFEFSHYVNLIPGDNIIEVEVSDKAENKTTKTITVTYEKPDTNSPTIIISSPSNNTTVNGSLATVSGTAMDKESGIDKVTVNGSEVSVASNGSFSKTVNLTKGTNTITVIVIDKAGNKSTKTITVTYVPPIQTITITIQPDNPTMTVNGVSQEIDPGRGTKPVIIPEWSRTVVPVRAIVEALGGTISWDNTTRKVTINFGNTTIELWIDNPKAKVNGTEVWVDTDNHNVKPIIVNDRTMLPLRFVAESLGCDVGWDNDTRTITITYGG